MIPIFEPGVSRIENWISSRGAALNVDTNSVFVQDHWTVNNRLSLDLGARFESAQSEATGGIIGVDSTSIVPRLAASVRRARRRHHIFHATYGWYSGKYLETQVGSTTTSATRTTSSSSTPGPRARGSISLRGSTSRTIASPPASSRRRT